MNTITLFSDLKAAMYKREQTWEGACSGERENEQAEGWQGAAFSSTAGRVHQHQAAYTCLPQHIKPGQGKPWGIAD